jgi:hypothetical protein
MAHYRSFDIEMMIVPDVAGQYEAAFAVNSTGDGKQKHDRKSGKSAQDEGQQEAHDHAGDANHGRRYTFPPVGSYLTPDDAREQTEAWVRRWIDENFPD